MESIVSSRNLYIDSSADVGSGDNFTLQLGPHQLHAGDGKLLRLTLMSFDMYRNFYGVNVNNSKATLSAVTSGGTSTANLVIANKNYARLGEITETFAEQVRAALLTIAQANGSSASTATVVDPLPANTEAITATG